MREKKEETRSSGTFVSSSPRPARITVQLPNDAKLFVDNVACPLTSSTRAFDTPSLQPGREYYYTIRAEVTRNGQRRVQTQRVVVSSGRRVRVEFNNFAPAQTVSR